MANSSVFEVYLSRRMAALVGLGFASGLPLMLTGRTLRIWARDQGVDLATVGLIGLVTLPYAYKFLWAPVLDRVKPPILDRRRGWILIIQTLLVFAIAALAFVGPASGDDNLRVFAVLAICVAFLGASQDIVADAYRTDVLAATELGAGASIYTTGYRFAMLLSGAGAVWMASVLPWRDVYLIASGAMIVGMCATLFAPSPSTVVQAPKTFLAAVVEPMRDLIKRNGRRALIVLAFIFVFKLPDYMAAAMGDALLLDLGFTKQAISLWSLGAGTAITIPGALLGGMIVTKFGLMRSLVIFGIAQALSNTGYLVLAQIGEANHAAMMAVVSIEYFCMGLVAAGFIAFLMSQCNKRYSATQYALLSSLMGLSNSVAGAPSGYLVEQAGYPGFFAITILIAVPGLLMLPWLRSGFMGLQQEKSSRLVEAPT